MSEHTVGTREEWQTARDELATLEARHAELNEEIKKKRLELPWVPVEKAPLKSSPWWPCRGSSARAAAMAGGLISGCLKVRSKTIRSGSDRRRVAQDLNPLTAAPDGSGSWRAPTQALPSHSGPVTPAL